NFADATANDNTTPDSQFPGRTGAELAIWKGIVEWGSALHGDGTGDALGSNPLGSGGANFDAMWAGAATGAGGANANIASAITTRTFGDIAFGERPISNGWRMRFCDTMEWNDGPAQTGANRYDIQAAACELYGFALGLDFSQDPAATMYPVFDLTATAKRSI